MNKKAWITGAVLAIIFTMVIRITVYTEDCNLLVVGLTFLLSFCVFSLMAYCYRKLRNRANR